MAWELLSTSSDKSSGTILSIKVRKQKITALQELHNQMAGIEMSLGSWLNPL